jgi:hypothetical protein
VELIPRKIDPNGVRLFASQGSMLFMITIFCYFQQFLAKKIGAFLKNQCPDQIFAQIT